MSNDPQGLTFLYLVLMPGDNAPAWGPGLDGQRAADFARAADCTLVRWPVQVFEPRPDWGESGGHWHAGK